MNARAPERFEPWAWCAFALGLATLGVWLYLGSRPGDEAARLAYRYGPLVLGLCAAVFMLGALLFCLRRRPVLQRRRAWPLAVLGATLWLCSLPIAYPSAHEGKYSATRFRLPFEGAGRVLYGGEERARNPFLFDPSRRFGVCFEPAASGAALLVVAPCAATLEAVFEGPTGHGVVLRTAGAEFPVLEGLAEIPAFEVGAEILEGTALGHAAARLTMYLADEPGPGRGEGIPQRFSGYRLAGREVALGVPAAGQELEASPVSR
ncbi:MAG: hypothetical protein ABL998_19470 [Planctomycetota bacterium]